jgi:GTP-binding protein
VTRRRLPVVRREKFIEFGGPAATAGAATSCRNAAGLNTLVDYRYQQHFKAATDCTAWARTAGGKGADAI